jgi:molybdopterin-guanine dinucleotide biosynthesis protein A
MPEVSVAILAGGQSRRMGQDKALLPLGGRSVIERVIERVLPLSDDVTIITDLPGKYRHLGYRMVGDVYPGKGSLGGIYTAIHAAQYVYCVVVACDMPLLNTDLLAYLAGLAPGFDVVVPRIEGFPETMHAVYGKGCLEPIQQQLLADQLKIIGFFDDVRVRYVEYDEVSRFDPTFRSFININTPDDWERVRRWKLGDDSVIV